MASFNRADYENLYRFCKTVFYSNRVLDTQLQKCAKLQAQAVEQCIGQLEREPASEWKRPRRQVLKRSMK